MDEGEQGHVNEFGGLRLRETLSLRRVRKAQTDHPRMLCDLPDARSNEVDALSNVRRWQRHDEAPRIVRQARVECLHRLGEVGEVNNIRKVHSSRPGVQCDTTSVKEFAMKGPRLEVKTLSSAASGHEQPCTNDEFARSAKVESARLAKESRIKNAAMESEVVHRRSTEELDAEFSALFHSEGTELWEQWQSESLELPGPKCFREEWESARDDHGIKDSSSPSIPMRRDSVYTNKPLSDVFHRVQLKLRAVRAVSQAARRGAHLES